MTYCHTHLCNGDTVKVLLLCSKDEVFEGVVVLCQPLPGLLEVVEQSPLVSTLTLLVCGRGRARGVALVVGILSRHGTILIVSHIHATYMHMCNYGS